METTDDVDARVRQIVGRMSPLGERDVGPGEALADDLGYDSVAVIELALVLEDEFRLPPIGPEQASGVVTVADVARLVRLVSPAYGDGG